MGKLVKEEKPQLESHIGPVIFLFLFLTCCLAAWLVWAVVIGEIPNDMGKITFGVLASDWNTDQVMSNDLTVYNWRTSHESSIKVKYEFDQLKPGATVTCEKYIYNGSWINPNPTPVIMNCVKS
jgi:hypothetical protein